MEPIHTMIQLPTRKDTADNPTSTNAHRIFRGPATLLKTEFEDGGIRITKFEYDKTATVKALCASVRLRDERARTADLIATS